MVTRVPGTDASRSSPVVPAERLAGTRFSVDWVTRTGSTNADLLAAAGHGAAEGTTLVADHQSSGRGRRGRSWEAPPGASLLMSMLLRPDLAADRAGSLTAALGLAARHACRVVAGVSVGLKWPNDIIAPTPDGERKLGGILAESRVVADRVEVVVVGLGLNVTWPQPVPADLAGIAVALNHLLGPAGEIDRIELVVAVLTDLEARLLQIERGDDGAVWSAWREAAVTLGREVRVETGERVISGRAEDVTDLGRLVVRRPDGSRAEVDVGDVVHLRGDPD
jgi:BirA family biotin operon repressor/biotin-[acetyl-CoA-carboxylase] ligase